MELGACLNQELVPPVVQVLKSLLHVDVVHQHAAVCTTVERYTQALEPLLPCCVPNLGRARWSVSGRAQSSKQRSLA